MQKILTTFLIMALATVIAFGQNASSPGSKIVNSLKYEDINWKIPRIGKEVQRVVLANGMTVFLLPNRELPLVEAFVLIRTGDIYEQTDKMAIPDLTGTIIRSGGTKSMSPDSLNTLLEFMAASIETGISTESGTAWMSVLSKDIDLGFKVLADILMNPAFSQEKLELEKSLIKESIRRRNDSPGDITSREFDHLIYGEHPYGRILEWEYVKNIKREDLIAYHGKYFHPNNVMLAVSGDFTTGTILATINKAFAGWQKKTIEFPQMPTVAFDYKPGIYLIEKDISQANIELGQLGIKRDNPDRYAISLMNYILGGGSFTSRMTTQVRSNEGLAYHVGSSFDIGRRDYGMFKAECQTKNSTAHKAVSLMLDEIKKTRLNPVDTSEFAMAQDAYINQFVFSFTSPGQIVNQLMSLEYNGYPQDYYEKYLDNIRAVTIADIQRVAENYLKPENLTFLIVGKPSEFDAPFDDIGQVKTIPLTEPKID
jgi:zinc protease